MPQQSDLMKWLVGVATAAALALGGWNFSTVSSTETAVAVQKERVDNLKEQLQRIENALIRIEGRLDSRR